MYTCSLHAFFSAFRGSPLQALVTSDDAAESLPALLADADGVYGTLTPELLAAVCENPPAGRSFRSKPVETVAAQAAVWPAGPEAAMAAVPGRGATGLFLLPGASGQRRRGHQHARDL